MKRKLLYGLVSTLIVGGAIALSVLLIKSKPVPQKNNLKRNTIFVKAEKAEFTKLKSDMTYRGRITAYDHISLAAEVQGKIMQGDVRFKAGENFSKGDILVKIYSSEAEASIKSGKSTLLQTISKILPDLKVDYNEEYEKWSTFFNSIDIEKPLPALPEIASSKEKVFLAANNVLTGYYSLQQQEINLLRYTIKAPFNGSFIKVNKEIGAIASPGSELATIIRSDKLEVTVPVFPSDLNWIKNGDKVSITNTNGDIKTATVSRISEFVDESSQMVNVYIIYEAAQKAGFLYGEYVDVTFRGGELCGYSIPREAVVNDNFVYILEEKELVKTPVKVLRRLDDSYIINGFDPEMTIITESLASVDSTADYLAR
ncbi:MAG: HlyD family efflux transporter periplasmic adaptor subunit [Bacteroidales bacterium]|nr:HlyD family efflux transporter periplasmic adaptor subunit [Bacteroidales bacterium]MBN2819915.1 HlyD family efflux transporter periplasmic adaptor subunit [Bacteroidales bacterium]